MTSSNEIFFAKTNGACYWIVTRSFIQIFKKCNDPKNPLREGRKRKKGKNKTNNNKQQAGEFSREMKKFELVWHHRLGRLTLFTKLNVRKMRWLFVSCLT